MHVYAIGPDHLIANDHDDAGVIWCVHHGEHRGDHDPSDMSIVADDMVLYAFIDGDGRISDSGETLHLTARQWADREGRGFLFSSEY